MDRKMKIGLTFWLLIATTCLSTGCVWRSAYYDPETGIVHGGGFDCFHRRWFNNMRDDLRGYRCGDCNRRLPPGIGDCESCGDVGDACGCGHDGPYRPRRSRHYGNSGCGCQSTYHSAGPYEVYGDDEYVDGEYFDGEYVDGHRFVPEGEVVYENAPHIDHHRHERSQQVSPTPARAPQAHSDRLPQREDYPASEGWREVSPNEYYNAADESSRQHSARRESPSRETPPVSIDTDSMTTIRQRNSESRRPELKAPPATQPRSSSAPSAGEPLSAPRWNPPTPAPNRSIDEASSMKWVPSRL